MTTRAVQITLRPCLRPSMNYYRGLFRFLFKWWAWCVVFEARGYEEVFYFPTMKEAGDYYDSIREGDAAP